MGKFLHLVLRHGRSGTRYSIALAAIAWLLPVRNGRVARQKRHPRWQALLDRPATGLRPFDLSVRKRRLEMLVQQILKSKSSEGVLTVTPGSMVSDAVLLLSERRIGSLVVSSDGKRAEGILSERDVVREIGRRGAGCLNETVGQMMTRNIVTCTQADSADQVLELMTNGRFRHLPVVEDGVMIGLISIGDVVKARLSELAMEKDALEGMIMGH
jgi:CBS domain-containing protein